MLSISSFHLFLSSLPSPSSWAWVFTTVTTYPIRQELMLLEVLLAGPIYSGCSCWSFFTQREKPRFFWFVGFVIDHIFWRLCCRTFNANLFYRAKKNPSVNRTQVRWSVKFTKGTLSLWASWPQLHVSLLYCGTKWLKNASFEYFIECVPTALHSKWCICLI